MNKRAMGLTLIAGVGFLLAVIFFMVYSMRGRDLAPGADYIGAVSVATMKARYQGEQALLFVDYSAKYALPYAILETADNGGLTAAACGTYLYPLWDNRDAACMPDAEGAIRTAFGRRFQSYLAQYPGIPLNTHQYLITRQDVEKKGKKISEVSMTGFAGEAITIPITTDMKSEPRQLSSTSGFLLPVQGTPIITSCYGLRFQGTDVHNGIDFAVPMDSPILAAGPGSVVSLCNGDCGGFGNNLIIKHGNSLYSRYSHLNSIAVKMGDSVISAQTIAYSGSTGHSTGPHLDFRIYAAGDFGQDTGKNPLCYFTDNILKSLTSRADNCKTYMRDGNFDAGLMADDCTRINPESLREAAAIGKDFDVNPVADIPGLPPLNKGDISRINAFQPFITVAYQQFGVEESLIKAVITQESRGNPLAVSEGNAKGLMQIVQSQHDVECRRECGFTSDADYFDAAKNICCGTYILTTKYRKDKKYFPQEGGTCCAIQEGTQVCNGGTEYVDWEASLRGYNTWSCKGADPKFVEKVMSYYHQWGGSSVSRPQFYANQIGEYAVKPNFKVSYPYDLVVYEGLSDFVFKDIITSYGKAKSSGMAPEAFLSSMIYEFNKAYSGLVVRRFCPDYPSFYNVSEKVLDCVMEDETDCLCAITIDPGTEEKQSEIAITSKEIILKMYDQQVASGTVALPKETLLFGQDGTQVQQFILRLAPNSVNFQGTAGPTFYLKKANGGLTFTLDPLAAPLCAVQKHYYSLCADQIGVSIPKVEDGKLIEKPVWIKISFDMIGSIPNPRS